MSVSDLTGTKWMLNETIEYDYSGDFPDYNSPYNITFNAYCESGAVVPLSGLLMASDIAPGRPPVELYMLRYASTTGTVDFYNFWSSNVLYTGNNTTSMTNSANDPTFNTELFNRTIEFTGGTDVTNPDLISWLSQNATLMTPSVVQITIDMATVLTRWSSLTAGTHTLQIQAEATGYKSSILSTGVQFTKAPQLSTPTISLGGGT